MYISFAHMSLHVLSLCFQTQNHQPNPNTSMSWGSFRCFRQKPIPTYSMCGEILPTKLGGLGAFHA